MSKDVEYEYVWANIDTVKEKLNACYDNNGIGSKNLLLKNCD